MTIESTLLDYISNATEYSEGNAAKISMTIIATVDYIHKKHFCHRDLKPENILFEYNSESDFILKLSKKRCNSSRFWIR